MALKVQSNTAGASRHLALMSGFKIANVEVVAVAGGSDYTNGFDLDSIKNELGFEVIWDVLQAIILGSNGNVRSEGGFLPLWDQNTGKLRFYRDQTPVPVGDGELEEIIGANLGTDDVIRCLIIGR